MSEHTCCDRLAFLLLQGSEPDCSIVFCVGATPRQLLVLPSTSLCQIGNIRSDQTEFSACCLDRCMVISCMCMVAKAVQAMTILIMLCCPVMCSCMLSIHSRPVLHALARIWHMAQSMHSAARVLSVFILGFAQSLRCRPKEALHQLGCALILRWWPKVAAPREILGSTIPKGIWSGRTPTSSAGFLGVGRFRRPSTKKNFSATTG